MHETGYDKECSQPSREKYWKELSIEEKIERTRMMLKQKTYELETIAEVVYRLKAQFENHSHSDSKIVTPINNPAILQFIRTRFTN